SAKTPMIKGTTAPPTIPAQRIPAKVPWATSTESRANEIKIDHITERQNPEKAKAIKTKSPCPNKPVSNELIPPIVNRTRTNLLSMNFSKTNPNKQPKVNSPQKYEIT